MCVCVRVWVSNRERVSEREKKPLSKLDTLLGWCFRHESSQKGLDHEPKTFLMMGHIRLSHFFLSWVAECNLSFKAHIPKVS